MGKINVAELLKDCPKGMELDCTIFSNVTFNYVAYDVIWIKYFDSKGHEYEVCLDCEGCLHLPALNSVTDKCVIFPKGKNTWDGFQRPFKDGDIISNDKYVAIFYKIGTPCGCKSPNVVYYHCHYSKQYHEFRGKLDFGIGYSTEFKYATEEEKEKLFKVIKAKGYKWNAETKTLEKLIKPKFKMGDRIKHKKSGVYCNIGEYAESFKGYNTSIGLVIRYDAINDWELYPLPSKFDITTLKPFDKVLVAHKKGEWHIQFFEKYSPTSKFPFICIGGSAYQRCVPYEENKHLMDTTDDCDEYFKIWEN